MFSRRSLEVHPARVPSGRLAMVMVLAYSAGLVSSGEAAVSPDLNAKAEAQGSIRVIVELRVDERGVAAAGEAILRGLAGTRYRLIRQFTAIPFLALDVSSEALRRLASLSEVVSVQEDRIHAPQEKAP